MGLKFIFYLLTIVLLLQSCGECKPDKYGEILELVVPITTSPAKDTFATGDTILIEAHFGKLIEVYNTIHTFELDSFDFFTDFLVLEISDTVENYYSEIVTIVEVGQVGYLPLQGALTYPLTYFEDEDGYHIVFKIVLKSPGMFWVAFSTSSFLYDKPFYDHPALYVCDQNRRDRVEVYYENSSSTLNAYNEIFLKTKVDHLKKNIDFESYSKVGSHCIVVR